NRALRRRRGRSADHRDARGRWLWSALGCHRAIHVAQGPRQGMLLRAAGMRYPGSVAQDRRLDLPLDAILGRGQPIYGHRPDPAPPRAMRHHPRVELTGLAGRESVQQVELAFRDRLLTVHAVIGNDEVTGRSTAEGALTG